MRYWCAGLIVVGACAGVPAEAQQLDSLPEGVTPEVVAEGRALFHGVAVCAACHGQDGQGVDGLGPDLGDTTWVHSDGSLETIVEQIRTGVPSDQSTSGIAMPPMGGARLSDEQLRAVAAYVWSLRYNRS